jgi:predicted SAM-dependent methyltransferase
MSGARKYYSETEYLALLQNNTFIHYDLSYGIPFEDESVNIIYSSHFLEHLPRKTALNLLSESYRVLKSGGIIRICIPDLAYAVALYAGGEKEKMLDSYFFIDDQESYFARHKYMYDLELIEKMLQKAGFRETVRYSYQKGAVPDLTILDNRPDDTLFVESKK